MTELNKIFKHLSRDLYIYFLTGFIFSINFLYLDYLFNCANTIHYVLTIPYWIVGFIILSFTNGHIIFSIMYFVFECSNFESCIKKKFFKTESMTDKTTAFKIDYKKEITIFSNKIDLHEQFIERHTQLYLMRWNMSAALIFSGFLNIFYEIYYEFSISLTTLSILLILIGFIVYILSLTTEKDCFDRINTIESTIEKK